APVVEKPAGPEVEVEVTPAAARGKDRVPVAAGEAPQHPSADGASRPPPKPAPASRSVKPAPKRRRREGPLRYAALSVATAARSHPGRWALAASVLALLGLTPLLFPSFFASELKTRGEKVAHAWLARDVEQVKQFVNPSEVGKVDRWLKEEPPPT